MSNLVQPIIVAKTGSHEDTVMVGMRAAVVNFMDSQLDEKQVYENWLSGPFTKTVRRASPLETKKLIEWCEQASVSYTMFSLRESFAVAVPPMIYEEFPKFLSRLQVSGTDFAKSDEMLPSATNAPVEVLVLDSLSTGKATAQAAHALFKWALAQESETLSAWKKNKSPVRLSFVDSTELSTLFEDGNNFSIHDNGLTEVSPNTLTAVAIDLR